MMDNDVISFTKLGTVKSKDFGEFTYETFFDRMIELINRDVVNNQIIHEKNEKRYKIIYKGNTYKVTYGEEPLKEDCKRKDIVNSLNRLFSLLLLSSLCIWEFELFFSSNSFFIF